MPQKVILTLEDSIPFSANATSNILLPLNGYVSHVDCLLDFNASAGAGATPAQDGLLRIIKAARMTASGIQAAFDINGGRQWYYYNLPSYPHAVNEDLPAASSSSDVRVLLPIHFGIFPGEDFDKSGVVPLRDLSNAKFSVDWGAASDIGSGYTINSGVMRLTMYEWDLLFGESKADLWPAGIPFARYEARSKTINTTFSNLGFKDDVPVGAVLKAIGILVLNGSNDRSDTTVTEAGVLFEKTRATPIKLRWIDANRKLRSKYRIPVPITGVGRFDLPDLTSGVGIDLTNAQVGDVRIGFTVGSGAGSVQLVYFSLV
jgi:hypothetical protein